MIGGLPEVPREHCKVTICPSSTGNILLFFKSGFPEGASDKNKFRDYQFNHQLYNFFSNKMTNDYK